jgi:ABC-type glycerol-3-phosphate transport system permease component
VLSAARALLIYGLLLGGAVVFSLPFVWMIGTSFKVDREMFGEKITLLPMTPVPATASPYLDVHYFRAPRDEFFALSRPVIESTLRAMNLGLPTHVKNRDEAVALLTPGVYQRLRQTAPAAVWQLPPGALNPELASRINKDLVDEVIRQVYRRLSLGAVRVRSFDLQEIDVVAGQPLSSFWQVEGTGSAQLMDYVEGEGVIADLAYDFTNVERGEIRLSRTIDLPFPAERLYRIQLFIRPDDSWHPVDFYVEKLGKQYRGKRPEFMGNFQWSVVTLQDYGPDDESTKIRLWIPLMETSGKDAGAETLHATSLQGHQIKLTIVIRQNTALGAWWAKCQKNYRGALDYIPFWRYTATSVFLVLLNIVGTLASCSLVAFAFARLQWPGRNISFGLMMATMMIPGQVTMIPYFLIIKSLGWYNPLTPLWVMSLCGNAFNIFLLRQFMKGIPRDLEDAARIDGCTSLQVYWHVIMPLIKPTLACIAIFTFMGVWNDFMGPLIYLSDQRLYPLSLGLYAFNVQSGGNFGMMMAGSLLMTLPVIVIFFFAQKYFIQGVTLTGMKG